MRVGTALKGFDSKGSFLCGSDEAAFEFRARAAEPRKNPMNRAGLAAVSAASGLSEIALFASTHLKRLRRHANSFAIRKRVFANSPRAVSVIARSSCDEAIQFFARFWIASLRSQ
jgi:hypothetical protein